MKNKHIKRVVETIYFTDGSNKRVISEPNSVGMLEAVREKETTVKVNSTYTVPTEYVNPWDGWHYPYTVPPSYPDPYLYQGRTLAEIYDLLEKILEEIKRGNKKD